MNKETMPFRSINLFTIFIALCLFCLEANAKNIQILSADLLGGTLTVKHDSMGDVKFRKRIYDGPPRLVFDILEADLGNKVISYPLTNVAGLKQVRIAQFEPGTVRVVVEAGSVSALEKITIDNIGHNILFRFAINNIYLQTIDFEAGDLRIIADANIVPRTIKLENPTRMVLDLIGAKLKSPSQARSIPNGEETISIAQHDESIVRITFAGKQSHKREVRISNNEKQLLVLGDSSATLNSPNKASDKLNQIKILKNTDKEVIYVIEANKKIEYKYLRLHNPERLVLDILGMGFDDAFGSNQTLESNYVSHIRYGLATIGTPVTRIVFDLKSTALAEDFQTANIGRTLMVSLLGDGSSKTVTNQSINPSPKSLGTKIILDAGHGGYDHGAVYGGHNEKDITLSITKKVNQYLNDAGIQSYLIRSEDRFVSLAERVDVSNAVDPKAFISIHVNALATNTAMDGLQTYYHSNSGYKLATFMHSQLLANVGMPDRKIRRANFWVCKYTKAPSVLLELGFMTNVAERNKLASNGYQEDLAKAIVKGIIAYLEEN
jgi:N-acetylmuramoyl-L-alanine amidase